MIMVVHFAYVWMEIGGGRPRPQVLVGWPRPLGFGLDGRLLLAWRHGVGGFMFNSPSPPVVLARGSLARRRLARVTHHHQHCAVGSRVKQRPDDRPNGIHSVPGLGRQFLSDPHMS